MEEEEESQSADVPSTSQQMDADHEADEESEGAEGSKGGVEASLHINQCRRTQNWESEMEETEGLAFDDCYSDSDTTITGVDSPSVPPSSPHDQLGDSPPNMSRGSAPHSQESPMEAGERPPLTAAVLCRLLVWMQWRCMSPSLSWTTCKVEARVCASPGCIGEW